VAAKTGTTNDYHDAWTIGYTPSLLTGVWVGNSDNKTMKKGADGAVVAAPIWHEYMQKVLGDTPVENFNPAEIPQAGKPILDGQAYPTTIVKIDKSTGLLATDFTPASYIEEKSFYSQPHCILYYVNKDDPLGSVPTNPASDPQFNLWESRVQAWAAKQKGSSSLPFLSTSTPPTEYDFQHKLENQPTFSIISPTSNQTIVDANLNVTIEASAPRGVNRTEYYLNDNPFYVNHSYPFNMNKDLSNYLNNGFHKLKVRVCDDIDNCSEKELEFNYILSGNENKTLSTSLVEPGDNSSFASSSFPVSIKIKVNDPNLLAKTMLYVDSENNSPNLIGSSIGAGSDIIDFSWPNVPKPGSYQIYAETHSWSGDDVKTNAINVFVN
jgi:membrane carboxypeptidase/penicillin-binding protein PbpC